MPAESEVSDSEFWLFGYGSLIWKPPPHFGETTEPLHTEASLFITEQTVVSQDMLPDTLEGFGSQDHRGTPEAPGRVVTLIERSFWHTLSDPHPSGSDQVWGTAYRIQADKEAEVREYLDIREINGYTIHYTPFRPSDGSPTIRTLVYIGTPDNDQFMGPQDPQELAEHIHRSVGPSGLNKDYLLSLEVALDSLSLESGDEHVKDLANRVRLLEQSIDGSVVTTEAVGHELQKSGSTDEQEETEK